MADDVGGNNQWVHAVTKAMADTGTSHRALGKALGVTGQAVDQWLTKAKPPAPDRVFAIERVLGLEAGCTSRLLGYRAATARDDCSARVER